MVIMLHFEASSSNIYRNQWFLLVICARHHLINGCQEFDEVMKVVFKAGTCTNSTNFYFFKEKSISFMSKCSTLTRNVTHFSWKDDACCIIWPFYGHNDQFLVIKHKLYLCLKRVLAPIRQTFISLGLFKKFYVEMQYP